MNVRVIEFKPEHVDMMNVQSQQEYVRALAGQDYAKALKAAGPAYSAEVDGQIVASAGLCELWPGRAHAWALISSNAARHFVAIHKPVARALAVHNYRRVEATVDSDFEAGHRWIRMLGFKCETPDGMEGYNPDGRSVHLYSRVRTA